ncbi:MAG: Uncharacterized protein Athens101410_221 [Parcubacteria group bacterium Athens1014_10]|nr:MAG: Uncharacterized protein Athens101410_221 [Parcubacteria group bacterium Athens1014_10]TSD04763.1 MAG: Uncharacterized protein Athens071412_638 [Parcubacteria group bacterium Athens0714_12]
MKINSEKILWAIFDLAEDVDKCLTYFPRSIYYANKIEYYHLLQKLRLEKERKRFNNFINYLKKKNYIKLKNEENKRIIALTSKGRSKAIGVCIKKAKKNRRKDKKLVLIIFDIPEVLKKSRNLFRANLKIMGYKMVQQSTWVCAYDVLDLTKVLIEQYALKDCVKIFLVNKFKI